MADRARCVGSYKNGSQIAFSAIEISTARQCAQAEAEHHTYAMYMQKPVCALKVPGGTCAVYVRPSDTI